MSSHNSVVWHEGLFIRPQHFQQQERYWSDQLHQRVTALGNFSYGVLQLQLSQEHLGIGQFALVQGYVLFADGTLCRFPDEDAIPAPLLVPSDTHANQVIYLTLALDGPGTTTSTVRRYQQHSHPVIDHQAQSATPEAITLQRLQPELQLGEQGNTNHTRLPIARLLGHRSDGSLLLDPDFMPCSLVVHAMPTLHRALIEVTGLLTTRAQSLSQRLATPHQQEISEWHDFLLLQLLQRYQLLLQHLQQLPQLHPERLFSTLLQLHAELATLMSESRHPSAIANYQHQDPGSCFIPLLNAIRTALGTMVTPRALALPLQVTAFGIRQASLHEASALGPIALVLAVKAQLPVEQLQQQFPLQSKIADPEQIRERIALQLPGLPLRHLPVAPRHLPYHAGFSYFELDRQHPDWTPLIRSAQLALHVAGEFPGLELQLWAIRD